MSLQLVTVLEEQSVVRGTIGVTGLVLSFGDDRKIIGRQQEMTGKKLLSRTCHHILSNSL